jgi:hypothetical protein
MDRVIQIPGFVPVPQVGMLLARIAALEAKLHG